MKKVLFLSLVLAMGMTSFAQRQQYVKAQKEIAVKGNIYKQAMGKEKAVEGVEFNSPEVMTSTRYGALNEYSAMITNYDLQGNAYVANRMARFNDGSVGVTATWSLAGTAAAPDRGTGYNLCFPDGDMLYPDGPTERVEDEKTGWPSYAQWGDNGEIIVAHNGSGQMLCYTRPTKGEGEWTKSIIPNPNLGVEAQELTWPRVICSGPNNDIIHVIAADQCAEPNLGVTYTYYARSTDAVNWEVGFIPTLEEDGEEGYWSADQYALAANGNNVAILLTGDIMANTYIIKSEDNGETWTKIKVWDNPYAGLDWENDEASLFGEDNAMYGPDNGAICIDNNGMVHAAFSAQHYMHDELGTSYTFYLGMSVDGIFYWNETMGTVKDEGWTCPEDGHVIEPNDHNCFRMWWPTSSTEEYITRNFGTGLAGFIDEQYTQDWDNAFFYYEDYKSYWGGSASCLPAICIDADGTIAIAYSCPDPARIGGVNDMYYRSVYMSYIEFPYAFGDAYAELTEEAGNFYYHEDYFNDDFIHYYEECIAVSSIQNTTDHEFWFSFQADDLQGLGIGNSATQGEINNNTIYVMKVTPDYVGLNVGEAVNPMTDVRVYPNPVQDVLNIEVNASMASEMSIAVYNITGQKVMETSANVNAGINTPSINVSSLNSGIYFVTVKANGFENTMKFVVK